MSPAASHSFFHTFLDDSLKHGTTKDEIPLDQAIWTRLSSRSLTGGNSRDRTKFIKSHGFETQVYSLDKLTIRSHTKCPIVATQVHMEPCYDCCHHQDGGDKAMVPVELQKNESPPDSPPTTIQSTRESNSPIEIAATSSLLMSDTETQFIDQFLQAQLTPSSPAPSNNDTGDGGSRCSMHVRSHIPPPPPIISYECYFDDSNGNGDASLDVGRDCFFRTNSAIRDSPVFFYMSKHFPLNFQDLFPVLPWLATELISADNLRHFEASCPAGFPIRVEVPLMPSLKMRVTILKGERRCDTEVNFNVPENYTPAILLPLFMPWNFTFLPRSLTAHAPLNICICRVSAFSFFAS